MSKQNVRVVLSSTISHENLTEGKDFDCFETELILSEDDFLEMKMDEFKCNVLENYVRLNNEFWNKKGDQYLGPKEITLKMLRIKVEDWNYFYNPSDC